MAAYNQENFIREAVEAAFSQTYSPLEIILSDDRSMDSTFSIMKEMAASYRGPHKVLLNRNERNLGVAAHCDKIYSIASGDFIVGAAGDDISMPTRTSEIVAKFHSNPAIASVMSDVLVFGDREGYYAKRPLGRHSSLLETILLLETSFGASAAYDLRILKKFPPLRPRVQCEDGPAMFRCALFGENHFISKPLVKYRVNQASIMNRGEAAARARRHSKLYIRSAIQHYRDLEYFAANYRPAAAFYLPLMRLKIERMRSLLRSDMRSSSSYATDKCLAAFFRIARVLRLLHFKNWTERRDAIRRFPFPEK